MRFLRSQRALLPEALLSGDDCVCTGSTWDASCWLHLPRDRAGMGVESSSAPPALRGAGKTRENQPVSCWRKHLFLQSSQRIKEQGEMGFSICWVRLQPRTLKVRQWWMEGAWTWNPEDLESRGSIVPPPISCVRLGLCPITLKWGRDY